MNNLPRICGQSPQLKLPKGFSLVELMTAITISLVVLSGLSYVLANSHKTSRIQSGVQNLQEHGRLALEMMARDIRGAGYVGCSEGGVSLNNNLNVAITTPAAVKGFEHSTLGVDRVWYPSDAIDPTSLPTATYNSDSLVLTYATPSGYQVTADTGTDTFVELDNTAGIEVDDILFLSNCNGADIFQATVIEPNKIEHTIVGTQDPGNVNEVLGNVYIPGDDILRFTTVTYFVDDDAGTPTLYRALSATTNTAGAEPFIPGVESFQILYGEDTGGTNSVDEYRQADDITNWSNVRTVQVGLLLRTEDEYGSSAIDTNTDDLFVLDFDYTVNSNSRHRRRLYTSTIEVRNGY